MGCPPHIYRATTPAPPADDGVRCQYRPSVPRPPSDLYSVLLAAIVATTMACAGPPVADDPRPTASATGAGSVSPTAPSSPSAPHSPSHAPSPSPPASPTTTSPTPDPATIIAIRVESRVADHPTDAFRTRVAAILTDPRGWERAGFAFEFVDDAPYTIVLAEGEEVDELCLPMDTFGAYSCQNGPVVALNADRWRDATTTWTGTVDEYRTMLVNHEVGHLLHLHHPEPQCPGPDLPAPVMMQQSSELGECTANPWPLEWEVDLAAEQAEPLAPPASHDAWDHRPSPPPAAS